MSKKLKVLVGFEASGSTRRAFRELGHDAWSCDILPSDDQSEHHFQYDIRQLLESKPNWDLAIFHPPCTYLTASGLHWNKRRPERAAKTEEALEMVKFLMSLTTIPSIAIENPVGCISTRIRKPDQIIQPWQFGHPESKSTCLWLKNLPPLTHTNVLPKPACGYWSNQTPSGQNKLGPSPDRWKLRSATYEGWSRAMAMQWGGIADTV